MLSEFTQKTGTSYQWSVLFEIFFLFVKANAVIRLYSETFDYSQ